MRLRRPTLVRFVVVSGYRGLRGFCGFLVASVIYLVRGTTWGAFGVTALQHIFLCSDVTSGLPDDIIIDAHTDGSQTDSHFRVTSDVMGHDVTSG